MKNGLMRKLRDVFAEMTGKNRFDRIDFVILKTSLMLAAVDGEIAESEIERFRELAVKCRGYSGESFDILWDAAVRSAGYLLLQSHLLDRDGLVAEFVAEAGKDFVGEVIRETSTERMRAIEFLDRMAMSDGDYSEVEHACISALVQKVKEAREKLLAERYPQGAKFGK